MDNFSKKSNFLAWSFQVTFSIWRRYLATEIGICHKKCCSPQKVLFLRNYVLGAILTTKNRAKILILHTKYCHTKNCPIFRRYLGPFWPPCLFSEKYIFENFPLDINLQLDLLDQFEFQISFCKLFPNARRGKRVSIVLMSNKLFCYLWYMNVFCDI